MVVNNLRVIMVFCFLTAFSAGVVVGKLWERSEVKAAVEVAVVGPTAPIPPAPPVPPVPPKPEPPELSWLKDLKLSTEQSEKMRSIWSELMKNGPMSHSRRDALRKERDEAIKALMSDDQRKQQSAILTQFDTKNDEIGKQMRTAQDTCRKQRDEALKAIFDPEKRKQYDLALKTYEIKSEELSKEWKKAFDDAVERTRLLLTPEQRIKYDEIRKKREEQPHRHFGPDGSDRRIGSPRSEGWNGPRPQ